MVAEIGVHDWRDRKLREWQLLLLRFAVTLDQRDRRAVEAIADELDSLGELRWRPAAPSFFRRTSTRVCDAILAGGDDLTSIAVLRKHIAWIDDVRLMRAFRAALDLRSPVTQKDQNGVRRRETKNLWTGLLTK
jgi:hypothetical protein